jgi:hypothetical protein
VLMEKYDELMKEYNELVLGFEVFLKLEWRIKLILSVRSKIASGEQLTCERIGPQSPSVGESFGNDADLLGVAMGENDGSTRRIRSSHDGSITRALDETRKTEKRIKE